MPAVKVEDLKGKTSDELMTLLKEQNKQITKLEETAPQADAAPAAPATEAPTATNASADTAAPAVDAISEGEKKELSEVKEANKQLTERFDVQENVIKTLSEENKRNKVEVMLSAYTEKGIPTEVINKMREVMLSDGGEKTIKMSETKDEKTVQNIVSLSDAICAIVDSFPAIILGEQAIVSSNGSGDVAPKGKDTDLQTVNDYVIANKCTFREAQSKLFNEGKIKNRGY